MAVRVAQDIPDGSVVNLGIGLPPWSPITCERPRVILHSENGVIGMGPAPAEAEDYDLINAGKQP